MRMVCCLAAAFAVTASVAAAGETSAVDAQNCRPSMDQWVEHEGAGGLKILETHFRAGAIGVFTVRWNNGAEQLVTVMPSTGMDGKAAVCMVARETLKSAGEAAIGLDLSKRS
jgi:hypothetical protein